MHSTFLDQRVCQSSHVTFFFAEIHRFYVQICMSDGLLFIASWMFAVAEQSVMSLKIVNNSNMDFDIDAMVEAARFADMAGICAHLRFFFQTIQRYESVISVRWPTDVTD